MSDTQEEMKTDDWGDSIEWSEMTYINESSQEKTSNWWEYSPELGETYIVLFNDKKVFLGNVNDVENVDGKYFTLKNIGKSLLFQTEMNGSIKMKTDDYEILDIKKLKKYDMKLLELPDSLEDKINKTNDIAYTLVDEKDRVYSKQELKESLISTLYSYYNKDSEIKPINEIIEYVDTLIDLSGEDLVDKRKYNKWYVPIITNETKIFSEENEILDEILYLIDNDMLITDMNSKGDKNYNGIIKNLLHLWDNIIYDENNDGLLIDDYDGKIYRNCLNMNNCSGINGLYSFDEIKNNKFLKIPTSFDRFTGDSNFIEIKKPMKMNVMGILTIPHRYYPFISDNLYESKLTLFEKCILQELVKQTNIYKRTEFKKNNITMKTTKNYDYDLNTFTIHRLNSKNKSEFIDDVNKIKPSVKSLLMSLDDNIINSVKNYQDIAKLLINYEISYSEIDKEFQYINNILRKNTNISPRIYNVKNKQIVKKELTIERRISLSKDIIFCILNISVRNSLIKRFIDTFCVNSSDETDWFIGFHDKKRLLCKHYSYLTGVNNDNSFFIMKQKYQKMPPDDGNIYCKNCGEFICPEEFSHEDGFVDDIPTSTKEILIQNKDVFENYDETDMNNIGLLKNISQGLGVELNDDDIVTIIDIYSSLSEDIVANKRYNMLNITTGDDHPRTTDIKKQYKKDKKSLLKSLKAFQIFLKITNKIMVLICLSLIIISTAIPIYNNKYIIDFKLFNDNNSLNRDFIGKIVMVMKKISHTFGEKYTKVYDELYNEIKNYDVVNIQGQIENLINFFLSSNYPNLLSRFESYTRYKKCVENTYVNYEWSIYKPLSNNKLIFQINTIVNDSKVNDSLLLRTYNTINIENITRISSIENFELHSDLNINMNSLINTAFQRLFNLSISLHGKLVKPNFYLDTNIEKFYNDSDDKIKDLFIKSGWNNKTKTIGPISFKELRIKLIPNILKSFYEKSDNETKPCFTMKESCNDFIHININNYDLSMINVSQKRFYKHNIPDIFPSVNYSIIKDEIKDKIFKIFAFDPSNNIIKREYSVDYLGKFLLDISNISDIDIEDKRSFLEKDIPKNEKNFHKIIQYCHSKSRMINKYVNLPINITFEVLKSINNSYINEYFSLISEKDFDFDVMKLYNILEIIDTNKDSLKDIKKDVTQLFLQIEEKNNEILQTIGNLLKKFMDNNKDIKERFENIFIPGKKSHIKITNDFRQNLESLGKINYRNLTEKNIEDIFRLLVEDKNFDMEFIKDTTNEILYTLTNIINNGHKNSYISKFWRLSDVNASWYKKYVDTHYFSHHRDLYKKSGYKDFTEYFNKAKSIFVTLYDKLTKLTNGIFIQRNSTLNLTDNIKTLWRFLYLSIINELLVYSENLRYEMNMNDDDEDDANILERFSLDIIINILEKRYDITWIYSNKENLNELLGIQKEREKQKLIRKLDDMSNDKRHASTELHTIGTKNHFKASEKENMEYIEEVGYKNEIDDYSYIKELMNGQVLTENQYLFDDDLSNDNYDTAEQIDDDGGNMG